MGNLTTIPQELNEKLTEIKAWMFSGDQQEVARRARVKEQVVSMMLNRKRMPSKKVIECAIEVMNENKARFEIKPKLKIA